ncbi:recombinase family protein [Streptomyces cinnamoneus]|nr:recombinase family protein [Streptomyces cinnamoneus]
MSSAPGPDALREAVRTGECDVVVVFKLSRPTRRGAREALNSEAELREHGVSSISATERFVDTSDPTGVALIAALAEQESKSTSGFVRSAKTELRDIGSHTSGIAPYGFTTTREQRGDLVAVKLNADPVQVKP